MVTPNNTDDVIFHLFLQTNCPPAFQHIGFPVLNQVQSLADTQRKPIGAFFCPLKLAGSQSDSFVNQYQTKPNMKPSGYERISNIHRFLPSGAVCTKGTCSSFEFVFDARLLLLSESCCYDAVDYDPHSKVIVRKESLLELIMSLALVCLLLLLYYCFICFFFRSPCTSLETLASKED